MEIKINIDELKERRKWMEEIEDEAEGTVKYESLWMMYLWPSVFIQSFRPYLSLPI